MRGQYPAKKWGHFGRNLHLTMSGHGLIFLVKSIPYFSNLLDAYRTVTTTFSFTNRSTV
jgi:hypothetical protein